MLRKSLNRNNYDISSVKKTAVVSPIRRKDMPSSSKMFTSGVAEKSIVITAVCSANYNSVTPLRKNIRLESSTKNKLNIDSNCKVTSKSMLNHKRQHSAMRSPPQKEVAISTSTVKDKNNHRNNIIVSASKDNDSHFQVPIEVPSTKRHLEENTQLEIAKKMNVRSRKKNAPSQKNCTTLAEVKKELLLANKQLKSIIKVPSVSKSSNSNSSIKNSSQALIKLTGNSHHDNKKLLLERKRKFYSKSNLSSVNHPKAKNEKSHPLPSRKSNILPPSSSVNKKSTNSKCAKVNVTKTIPPSKTAANNKETFLAHLKGNISATSKVSNFNQSSNESAVKNSEQTTTNFKISDKTKSAISDVPSLGLLYKNADFSTTISDVEMMDVSEDVPSLGVFSGVMEVDNLVDNEESYAIVVDTNVFIDHLNFIDELKDIPLEGCGPPFLHIPWVVVQELDGLKYGNSDSKPKVCEAIRFIHCMFNSKHPRICGQSAKSSRELPKVYGDKNDDLLLSYCTFLSERIPPNKVILLTDDKNLCNKAIMNSIKAFTKDALFANIKPDIEVYKGGNHNSVASKNDDTLSESSKKEIDVIICEVRFHAKNILEKFLHESMKSAFGDISTSFLTPPPTSLFEILECYKKYWISVFGLVFDKSLRKDFETLSQIFNYKRGFICNVNDAFIALVSIEKIFKAIQRHEPSVRSQVQKVIKFKEKLQMMTKPKDEQENTVSIENESSSQTAYEVFNHIWKIINTLCGMIMDYAGMPHDLVYVKPYPFPELTEFQNLLTNLYPAMHKIKSGMSKVIEDDSLEEQAKHEQDYKKLYDYLLQFVPSLEIQTLPPPTEKFTLSCLKSFWIDPTFRNSIRFGYNQLQKFQQSLIQCMHLPLWQN